MLHAMLTGVQVDNDRGESCKVRINFLCMRNDFITHLQELNCYHNNNRIHLHIIMKGRVKIEERDGR